MKNRTPFFRIGTLCILAAFLGPGAMISPAQSADSQKITNLLSDASTYAARVNNQAADLDALTRSDLSWQMYAAKIEVIKKNVNELGRLYSDLVAIRDTGSPWQQNAIDQMKRPLLLMAVNLDATINYLNRYHARVHMPEFEDYIHANNHLAISLSEKIQDFSNYGEARAKIESLQQNQNARILD
ncbi:MAG TPA: hypothetical protein VMW15_06455 [Terracidiphilus sp.]|jgi:hypothetical protein|nr:hypothetical protein [Terracidiphilus sp.]